MPAFFAFSLPCLLRGLPGRRRPGVRSRISKSWTGIKGGWLLVLSLGLGAPARAQLQIGATSFAPAFQTRLAPDTLLLLSARLRRVGVSTYTQQSDLRGRIRLDSAGRSQLRYQLASDWIYDSRGEPPFVRQDYRADLAQVTALGASRHWRLGQQLHYDQSRTNATRTGSWVGRLGYEGRLRPGLDSLSRYRITALAGLASDTRNQQHDLGLAYGVDAAALLFWRGAAAPPLGLRVLASGATLGPRRVSRVLAEGGGEVSFLEEGAATVAARLGYRANRAEDYLRGSVQRIQSDTLAAQLGGSYRISPWATLRSDNALLLPGRAFAYRRQSEKADTLQDLGYDQREVDTRQELRVALPKLQTSLSYSYHDRRRAYFLDNSRFLNPARLATALAREQVKDITEKTTHWQLDLTWLPTPRHALSLLSSAQLLRVDAPSRDNQQTRDEAQHLLRLSWTGRWAGAFRTTLGVAGEYRQTVFIRAAQSAENYTDRLLHWEPGFTWAPGRFSLRSSYHLWVSYQVRDRSSEQARNRASRVLEQTQSVSWQLRPHLLLLADYVRRENRIGQLQWPAFRESPLDTSITHDFNVGLRQGWAGPRGSSTLRLGYRLLEQRSYGRAALLPEANGPTTTSQPIFLHQVTRQQGPEVAVERRASAGLTLAASLWLQWLRSFSDYSAGKGLGTGTSYSAADLARETKNLYPYFEVTLTWQPRRR